MRKNKLTLWIDTSLVLNMKTGIGAYVLTLIKALELLDINYKQVIFHINNKIHFKYFFHLIWMNTVLYLKTIIEKPDIIIFPSFAMPFFTRKKTKYITVIHDLTAYRDMEMSLYDKLIGKLSLFITIKKASTIVTVSRTIKNELIKKFNINPDRIQVINNSIAEHFLKKTPNTDIIKRYNLLPRTYILSVATFNKRKNIPNLVKAFNILSDRYPYLKLVLVGGNGNEMKDLHTNNPNIIFTGYINDYDIPTLYQKALVYVFPSFYEGFGTPILEAQYSKIPLICSDIPVFHEIAADGAFYCRQDALSISNAIINVIDNPQESNKIIDNAQKNIQQYTIENIAKQLKFVINYNENRRE